MSSLSMPLPSSFPVARPQWRSHASAATVTVALHAAVLGLLLHGWTPELTPPGSTQVLKTQLVSLPVPVVNSRHTPKNFLVWLLARELKCRIGLIT